MDDPAASRIESLRRKIQDDPGSKLFLQLAEAYRQNGELEEALETCRNGLEKNPCYHSARVSLGRLFLELGRVDEAEQELQNVLREIPDNLLARRLLEDIKAGSVKPAAGLKTTPSQPAAGDSIAAPAVAEPPKPKVVAPEPARATENRKRPAPESMPDREREPFETETLADIYVEQGHPEKAVQIFERILKSEPENTRVRDRLEKLRSEGLAVSATGAGAGETETVRRKIAVLRGWLDRIHKR